MTVNHARNEIKEKHTHLPMKKNDFYVKELYHFFKMVPYVEEGNVRGCVLLWVCGGVGVFLFSNHLICKTNEVIIV